MTSTPPKRRGRVVPGCIVLAVIALWGAPGCELPDDDPFGQRCGDDAACVQGYVCERGQCVPFRGFFDGDDCANDEDCNDGLFCTPAQSCQAGTCVALVELVCQGDSQQCFEGSDQCLECTATVPCLDDGDDCTEQLCDVQQGCVAVPIADCARCDVDTDCVPTSACEQDGVCVRHRCSFTPRDCEGRACDPVNGCRCIGVGPGTGCEAAPCGSAVCTPDGVCEQTAPACDAASCLAATGTCATCANNDDCDTDGNPCTADVCDTTRGLCVLGPAPCPGERCVAQEGQATCVSECADDTACVAEDPCQPAGACAAGTCIFPEPVSCSAGLGCIVDAPGATPRCRACLVDNDCPADNNPCTDALCGAGRCRQVVRSCLYGCDVTSADGACLSCASGLHCDDGSTCTVDSCVAGVCQHRIAIDDDAENCGARGCLERAGVCRACATDGECGDDGNACTDTRCIDGLCVHAEVTTCNAGCIPQSGCGACANDEACDDADACTEDSCASGTCTHTRRARCGPECTAARDCDDEDACTADFCDAGKCVRMARTDCADRCDATTGLCLP